MVLISEHSSVIPIGHFNTSIVDVIGERPIPYHNNSPFITGNCLQLKPHLLSYLISIHRPANGIHLLLLPPVAVAGPQAQAHPAEHFPAQ